MGCKEWAVAGRGAHRKVYDLITNARAGLAIRRISKQSKSGCRRAVGQGIWTIGSNKTGAKNFFLGKGKDKDKDMQTVPLGSTRKSNGRRLLAGD